jgi:hypothetical protein
MNRKRWTLCGNVKGIRGLKAGCEGVDVDG